MSVPRLILNIWSIFLIVIMLASCPAEATTFQRTSPTAIIGSADYIIVGQVVWVPEDKREGQVEIRIIEQLKGRLDKQKIFLPIRNKRYSSIWTSYTPDQMYLIMFSEYKGTLRLMSDIQITSTSAAAPRMSLKLGTCRPVSGLKDPAIYMVRQTLQRLQPVEDDPTAGLIPLLSSPDRDTKEMAMAQLLKLDHPKANEELVKLFPGDSELGSALYNAAAEDKFRFLCLVVRSPNLEARQRAILLLGSYTGKRALPLLREAIKDNEISVRTTAIGHLGKLGEPSDAALVGSALKDADPTVRIVAAEALGELNAADGIPFLTEALKNADDEYLSLLYAENITRIMGGEAAGPLIDILQSQPSSQSTAACIRVLGRLKTEDAIPIMLKKINDPNPTVRYSCVTALGLCRAERAIPLLEKSRDDEDELVRWATLRAIEQISKGK